MKFICVIPARSGSKGIKNKKVLEIKNKPLVEYTFTAAINSKVKETYVLTDSNKIKKIAKKFGIITDYIRPKELSSDKTSLVDTLYNFDIWLTSKNLLYDYMVILQPTSPLRDYKDVNESIKMLKKNRSQSLFSISNSLEHPYEAITIKKNKWNYVLKKANKFYRRQDFDIDSYFINGAIYITHKNLIRNKKTFGNTSHSFYRMRKDKSLEINDKEEANIISAIIGDNVK